MESSGRMSSRHMLHWGEGGGRGGADATAAEDCAMSKGPATPSVLWEGQGVQRELLKGPRTTPSSMPAPSPHESPAAPSLLARGGGASSQPPPGDEKRVRGEAERGAREEGEKQAVYAAEGEPEDELAASS